MMLSETNVENEFKYHKASPPPKNMHSLKCNIYVTTPADLAPDLRFQNGVRLIWMPYGDFFIQEGESRPFPRERDPSCPWNQ